MTTSPMLTLAAPLAHATAASAPPPAATFFDLSRPGCVWYVVEAPDPPSPHHAHPHAA